MQGPFGERADDEFDDVRTQLDEYFAGTRTEFDLPLHLVGTTFQRGVWQGLLRIPFGQTRSYGELAAEIGLDPRTSSRAVGAANGRNRIAIVVPCHRVIGADGSLTGFAAGLDRKRFLLGPRGQGQAARAPPLLSRRYGGQPHRPLGGVLHGARTAAERTLGSPDHEEIS